MTSATPYPAAPQPVTEEEARSALVDQLPARFTPSLDINLQESKLNDWSGEPWSVTFHGPNGAGKTWQAIRLLLEAAVARETLDWSMQTGPVLAQRLRDVIGDDDPRRGQELRDRLATADILLLDDVGAMRDTEYLKEQLRFVLVTRDMHLRPTILTMDTPPSEMESRLYSRLKAGWIFKMDGEDLRGARR